MLEIIACTMFILHIIAGVIGVIKALITRKKKGKKIMAVDIYYYIPIYILLGVITYAIAFNPELND